MPTLPWTPTEPTPEAAAGAVLVLGSRLELRSYRHIPGFLVAALRLRREVHHMPGAFGLSLIAQLGRKTFWTLSAWTDQDAMDAFVRTQSHVEIMRRYHDRLAGTSFATWELPVGELPKPYSNAKDLWRDAKAHLVAEKIGAR